MLMAKPAPSWSLLAGSRQGVPAHMPAAAVPDAGDMPDEDLVRAEWVSVRATRRRAVSSTRHPSPEKDRPA
jgi:hypothetical protein